MEQGAAIAVVRELMAGFAARTGLSAAGGEPRRYLWTDAFAVCNLLELYRRTGEPGHLDLALQLVDQVHQVLGRHRPDDARRGWISGLDEEEGRRHPTIGGLRIGKELPERPPGERLDEGLEWDRDGQYYHYLTKWLHALQRVGRVTGEPVFYLWARELAGTAHARFTYVPPAGGRKRMYWKMSIDLSRPLVPSMGLHDPLDGLITCSEIQVAPRGPGSPGPDLGAEIRELAEMCETRHLATEDPLGTGGLLFDAVRAAQLTAMGIFSRPELLEGLLQAALTGLEAFAARKPFRLPAGYRLGFRELGLAIGLKAAARLHAVMETNPTAFDPSLREMGEALGHYVPWGEEIEAFWLEKTSRQSAGWLEHREINEVMLATSLAPGEFLSV